MKPPRHASAATCGALIRGADIQHHFGGSPYCGAPATWAIAQMATLGATQRLGGSTRWLFRCDRHSRVRSTKTYEVIARERI